MLPKFCEKFEHIFDNFWKITKFSLKLPKIEKPGLNWFFKFFENFSNSSQLSRDPIGGDPLIIPPLVDLVPSENNSCWRYWGSWVNSHKSPHYDCPSFNNSFNLLTGVTAKHIALQSRLVWGRTDPLPQRRKDEEVK